MIGGRLFLRWEVDAITQEVENVRNEKRNGGSNEGAHNGSLNFA
jgi:hypothetical protein